MANNKGSALIEAVILCLGIIPLISIFLLIFTWLSIDSFIDYQLDEHLLCRLENKSMCLSTTVIHLKQNHIQIIDLKESPQSIILKGLYLNFIFFHKKRQLQYDKKI